MKQRSILREASIKGKGLHTGEEVRISFKPAPAGQGIVFRRIDLYGKPEIQPKVELVTDLFRNTGMASGHVKLLTVEHVLSALSGFGVDNVTIELDGVEPPILDGSARPYVKLLREAEPVEQDKDRSFLQVEEPLSVGDGNRSLIALTYDGLRITCTSSDDRGFHTQHLSIDIDPDTYFTEIAPARTFTIYEDIEELISRGKIRGGSLDSAIVIKGDKILSKEPLRFKDEFVRHKILDIIGDLCLLGQPLKAHIVAVRPGHALNSKLASAILARCNGKKSARPSPKKKKPDAPQTYVSAHETALDIRRVLEILPHRYPFLLIDRVTEIINDRELVALKNVTFNEPYFKGHFPGLPVMPGVLQIEAMAQAAGVLMLRQVASEGKVAFFMSCDKVKFRRAVSPGDQILIHVKITKTRGNKIAAASCSCQVAGKVVSSADLMFTIMDAPDEG